MLRVFSRSFLVLCVVGLLAGFGPPRALAGPTGPAWIGVQIEKGHSGVRITQVMPQSPCAGADVHPGDEVLALAGKKITETGQLIHLVRASGVGATVELDLLSPQGKRRRVSLVLGHMPDMDQLQRNVLVGKVAPDFAPKVLSGRPLPSLASLRGQVVLLDFFASWCGPCMRALPEVSALHQRLEARGLRVVGVSSETAETIRGVIQAHALPYTVAMDVDEKASRAYHVFALPTMVVVDRRGMVREVALADLDTATREIEAALDDDQGPEAKGAKGPNGPAGADSPER
jgi:peroxiredoxin